MRKSTYRSLFCLSCLFYLFWFLFDSYLFAMTFRWNKLSSCCCLSWLWHTSWNPCSALNMMCIYVSALLLCVVLCCVCERSWDDTGLILCRSFPGLKACRESSKDRHAVCWGWGVCDTWREEWADSGRCVWSEFLLWFFRSFLDCLCVCGCAVWKCTTAFWVLLAEKLHSVNK